MGMSKVTPGARKMGDGYFSAYVARGDAWLWSQSGFDTKSEALAAAKKRAKAMKNFV
jgi:hypothetical protein